MFFLELDWAMGGLGGVAFSTVCDCSVIGVGAALGGVVLSAVGACSECSVIGVGCNVIGVG